MTATQQTDSVVPADPGAPVMVADDAISEDEAFLVELTGGLAQVRRGRFDVRLARREGLASEVVEQFNELVALKERNSRDLLRISRVVGREGRMSERLDEESYDGAWAADVQSVNALIDDLAAPTAEIARVLDAVAEGDLSQHMALEIEGRSLRGEFRRIGRTVNRMVDQLSSFADEVTRVAREVGTEGKLGGQADVRGVAGTWRALTDSVNVMASNLTNQVRSISQVTTAIAEGDLSRKITVSARGEIAELAETINSLTDTLRLFADEVTRVAREVGTEGLLGGQATVPGVAGTWEDLTDTVNVMAANLTEQVRGIVKVVTAVANGDLKQNLTVQSKGEVAALAETINNMTNTLATFADQVTTVAREVGVEGRLGGQANVPGAAGTWKDLTGNVNLLAANLTSQVRAIAEVATAVTKGDLTRSIQVDARGEVAELKDNINTMIDNLRVTTERNKEQDWLKTNLAKVTRMLQGQRDLYTVGQMLLSELAPLVNSQQGAVYQMASPDDDVPRLQRLAGYENETDLPDQIALGDGLVGQCAKEKQRVLMTAVPLDYTRIHSSLGGTHPVNVVVLPVLYEGQTK